MGITDNTLIRDDVTKRNYGMGDVTIAMAGKDTPARLGRVECAIVPVE